jgi:hypothetical protein
MTTIKSSTTTTTAYSVDADTTGALVIQTGVTPTTAVTIDTSQNTTLAGTLTTSSRGIAKASMPAGTVLQVVNTFKSDTTSATSAATLDTWVDITGMSVTITPSSSSNKILILYTLNINAASGESVAIQFLRNSTAVGNGDAASNRLVCFADTRMGASGQFEMQIYSGTFLDSPATTSSTTYKIQWRKPYDNGNTPIYLNRSYDDTDNNDRPRGSSSITVMEIAA